MFSSRVQKGYFVRRAIDRGFRYRYQLVMVKTNPIPSLSKTNWRSSFEVCMYVTKGKPGTFNFVSQAQCKNVFVYSITHKQTTHPTEKPLAFIELIVEVTSNPGDLIVDPFMGSGTTAVACQRLGRDFIGFELEPAYIRMARKRLKGGKAKAERRAKAA